MSTYKVVFSDIDGTLLTSDHIISNATMEAIVSLQDNDIPFVIISSRSAPCIYPILKKHHFHCPIVACGGAWIEDQNGKVLVNEGMTRQTASDVIEFMTEKKFDLAWGIYSGKNWITNDRTDERILHEEGVVEVKSVEGTIDLLPEDAVVNKILCMCNPERILQIEEELKEAFPHLSIVKSSSYLLEIMPAGMNKAKGIRKFCELYGIATEDSVAFGDNYNDLEMLHAAGCGVLMGNAPAAIKETFPGKITLDNNHDGIPAALKDLGLINNLVH